MEWNGESRNSLLCKQLIFDEDVKSIQWERIFFLSESGGKDKYVSVNKTNLDACLTLNIKGNLTFTTNTR